MEEDPYLSPFTEADFNKKRYWLKYCAFATVASIIPSIIGRAKGLPVPPPGIPFPVIYIPFFGIITKWGIFAIGLSITGIFPFPWVLFSNLSLSYNTPLGDPTNPVKKRIRTTKRDLSKKLRTFNTKTLKIYLNNTKKDIDSEQTILDSLRYNKRLHKINRPERKKSVNKTENVQNKIDYNIELISWRKIQAQYRIDIKESKRKIYILERKYTKIEKATNGEKIKDSKDPKIKSIQISQQALDLQLDQLDQLIDSVDLILKPLPITMKPDTSNFGFTLKNKKLIMEMADNQNKQVNQPVVNTTLKPFESQADDFVNTQYPIIGGEKLNRKAMKTALTIAMPAMIGSDPYPKYENLKITNLAWLPFLIKKWGPAGAKSFGIPF